MLFMIMKSDINKLVCILFVHLSSISLQNFKDRALIIPEILEIIKLHTYKFGLVYICIFFSDFLCFDMSLLLLTVTLRGRGGGI